MTRDMSEVYEYVIIENGQRIYSPENCFVCENIRENKPSFCVGKCSICGHYYIISHDTQHTKKTTEGKCWCECLEIAGFIEKVEDYSEYYKKCLMGTIGEFERIGISCDDCKRKTECEDGGTDVEEIKETIGYCINLVL